MFCYLARSKHIYLLTYLLDDSLCQDYTNTLCKQYWGGVCDASLFYFLYRMSRRLHVRASSERLLSSVRIQINVDSRWTGMSIVPQSVSPGHRQQCCRARGNQSRHQRHRPLVFTSGRIKCAAYRCGLLLVMSCPSLVCLTLSDGCVQQIWLKRSMRLADLQ